MKLVAILIMFVLWVNLSLAQSADFKAKAEFELAEASFEKNDHIQSLIHLENTVNALGKTNCKVLYLKILNERELAKKDLSYYDKTLASIKDFESNPDLEKFTEEKIIEIFRLKSTLEKERREEIAKAETSKKGLLIFKNYSYHDWAIGVKLDELKIEKKGHPFFKKTRYFKDLDLDRLAKLGNIKVDCLRNYDGDAMLSAGLQGIFVYNGTITGYQSMKYSRWSPVKDEDVERTKSLVTDLSTAFGFTPDSVPLQLGKEPYTTFLWESDGKVVAVTAPNLGVSYYFVHIYILDKKLYK